MTNQTVSIIDYGMGNIWSVISALKYLGYRSEVTSNKDEVAKAKCLLLPGVGSFRRAMQSLQNLDLDRTICNSVNKGTKILGICLGMQLLGIDSTEEGNTKGLNLIPHKVAKFSKEEVSNRKIPHIGFNSVKFTENSSLFTGVSPQSDFYFVHSYRMLASQFESEQATCDYGIQFLAAYEKNNIFATQFHPEKSQTNGLILLSNFLKI